MSWTTLKSRGRPPKAATLASNAFCCAGVSCLTLLPPP
ncbi:MAG: hypothetical protein EOO40_06980 [Deltaproteobacteria bacterium]|nr:MAG: hypothetical protein EOO40_06980 [Deltaproteobacteria bacterium]